MLCCYSGEPSNHRGRSSAGRARHSHCRGRGFDSLRLHHPIHINNAAGSSDGHFDLRTDGIFNAMLTRERLAGATTQCPDDGIGIRAGLKSRILWVRVPLGVPSHATRFGPRCWSIADRTKARASLLRASSASSSASEAYTGSAKNSVKLW